MNQQLFALSQTFMLCGAVSILFSFIFMPQLLHEKISDKNFRRLFLGGFLLGYALFFLALLIDPFHHALNVALGGGLGILAMGLTYGISNGVDLELSPAIGINLGTLIAWIALSLISEPFSQGHAGIALVLYGFMMSLILALPTNKKTLQPTTLMTA